MDDDKTLFVPQKDLPMTWYNVLPDLPEPLAPPLHPATKQPVGPEDLAPLFPMGLIEQEVSGESFIEIPHEIREIYKIWRPTPFTRADRLEKALDTPAKIFYKYEGASPAGSHKPNTAVAQAYYNAKEGVKKLYTETGAGQWGSALAMGCKFFNLECEVFMVRSSYAQKPYRRTLMQTWGASVNPSPSNMTKAGKDVLANDPDTPGSLGIAISEAIEKALESDSYKYSLGSVLNHVLLHQTVIGLEAKRAFEMIGAYPDIVIGCCGGGSNLGGIALPFVKDKIDGGQIRLVAVEPSSCATLCSGAYEYDFGDIAEMTPLLLMYTLGHKFIPPSSHAGGLRYHGASPIISHLVKHDVMEAVSFNQKQVFEAAMMFANTEGHVPAPETSHAIKAVIDEALKCKAEGVSKTILFNFSGHGFLDLGAYEDYIAGRIVDV